MPNKQKQKELQEESARKEPKDSEFIRAANEDDDLYDPYSDRPPEREPLFSEDPWA